MHELWFAERDLPALRLNLLGNATNGVTAPTPSESLGHVQHENENGVTGYLKSLDDA